MNVAVHCDQVRLKDFLLGDLSEHDEAEVIQHLDSCEQCRTILDDTAGGELWQQEVQTTLSPATRDEFDRTTLFLPLAPGEDTHPESAGMAEQTLAALKTIMGPTDHPDMLGRIGPFEVVGVIGRGSTGIVVKAFQPSLNRFVAIKVLSPELAANAAARQRFAREGQAAAAVVNEYVVPIYAVDEFRGMPYLVMQFVAGGSLDRRQRKEGVLSLEATLRIGMQIAAGLSAAHTQGLIHRDIKPANILLEHGVDRVLITDFGLARAVDDATLTHSGFVAGTPQFMSPEQARGDAVDLRTDLFSLGSVLYSLLAGRPPFRAETAYGILRRICDDPHRPLYEAAPSLPRWVSNLIDLFLEKNAEQRIRSAADAATLLAACLAHVHNPGTCPLPRQVRETPTRRIGRIVQRPAVQIGVLGLLTGAGCWYWASRPTPRPATHIVAELAQTAEYDGPVSISLVVPKGTRPQWRVLPKADPMFDDFDSDLRALNGAILKYELQMQRLTYLDGDLWSETMAEARDQLRRLENDPALQNPMAQSTSAAPASDQQTVERPMPPMAESGPPDLPLLGTPL